MSPYCPQGMMLGVTILSPRSGVGVTVLSPRNSVGCHHTVPKE